MINRFYTAKKTARYLAAFTISFIVSACSSSGPATTYYVLDAEQTKTGSGNLSSSAVSPKHVTSIGIGPVSLPAYLQNTSIVSKGKNNVLNVSGYHAWSEPLEPAISRLLAAAVGRSLGHNDVWAFPWDSRNRPHHQVTISVEQLDGIRGEDLTLRAKWFVYDSVQNTLLAKGYFDETLDLRSSSYPDYVAGIESALIDLAQSLTDSIRSANSVDE